MRGLILYQGPSLYDGKPIVAVATLKSANRKTGNMVQTWILRADVPPVKALRSGADASVCGTCPLRRAGCYVNVGQAPASVYRAFRRGLYVAATADLIAQYVSGRDVRLGAYGDPAAVPREVWDGLLTHARRHTGYTHGNVHPDLFMVSTSDLTTTREAWSRGARTFRAGRGGPVPGEIRCPAPRLSCEACGLCDGSRRALPSIYIDAHGAQASRIT